MVDSIRIKEIHACLGASEYATYEKDGEQEPAYMHIARRLDEVAKALGLCFDLAGGIISLRQSKHLDQGETIPAGWSLGQFGRNKGGSKVGQTGGKEGEERLGIVYEVKGNRFKTSASSGQEEIVDGGYVLCESLPQFLHVMLQDLDRSLGLQQLGSYVVANPNYNPSHSSNDAQFKTPYYTYNGLGQGLLDLLYLSQDTNRHASQANLGALKSQAISQEVLGALGVPVLEKNLSVGVDNGTAIVSYPGFNGEGMTLADLAFLILMNLAIQNEG
ncbi:phage hypothetical protein [Cyanobacterium sp. HL-69]|uniref:hypothetical protein n=1 Tax=Cyanobacterium sp. HL-69 TaxID=2054282 RepID=UPI000CA1E014|nr:phage hypothetical protein [Cyanobacterium sp. HL-69]